MLTVFPDGKQTRDFLFVEDPCQAIVMSDFVNHVCKVFFVNPIIRTPLIS